MTLSGRAALAFVTMAPLLLAAPAARADGPRCEPPVIHRHATLLPANAPGFLLDEGVGSRVTGVRVTRMDTLAAVPVTREGRFVRFDAPLEPHLRIAIDVEHDCATAPQPASYALDIVPDVPAPTTLGELVVGAQIEGLVPLGGASGAGVDPNGWEPVGVFRETVLRIPPGVLTYDALLDVAFVYDGREDAPTPPEPGRVDERHRSVVHARCDGGKASRGIGEGAHRIEAIGTFAGMDLALRVGPADVRLACTEGARASVEGHRHAVALRPWYEVWRWLRGIRQDTFAILVIVGFGVALVRFKRRRQRNWPFAPD